MKVSVIIPIYNVEAYLKDCIKSVQTQTMRDIEIICVDDGSTDNSVAIIEELSYDQRMHVIKNSENRGRLYTRKVGVEVASGNYIMFLDGDDFYSLDACELAYEKINDYNTDILQFGMNLINAGNAPQYECDSFEKFAMPYEGGFWEQEVLMACFLEEKYNFNLVNKIYRAEVCKKAFSCILDSRKRDEDTTSRIAANP